MDFREKVVAFVQNGGGQAAAARRFDISLWCVRDWLARQDLAPQQSGVARRRKWDKEALRAHVREQPEALLRERAVHFGVHLSVIGQAVRGLKLTRKKRPCNTRSASRRNGWRFFESCAGSSPNAVGKILFISMNPASNPRSAVAMAGARALSKSMATTPPTTALVKV